MYAAFVVFVSPVIGATATWRLEVMGAIPQWLPVAGVLTAVILLVGVLPLIFLQLLLPGLRSVQPKISTGTLHPSGVREPRIAPAKDAGEETAASPAVIEDVPVSTSEERAALTKEREQLQARVEELEATLADERGRAEREKGNKEALAGKNKELRFAVQNREHDLIRVYWEWRYGHDYPELPDLPLHESHSERVRLQELRESLLVASGKCMELMGRLCEAMRGRGNLTGFPWLADYIEADDLQRLRVATDSLKSALNGSDDIRRPLLGFAIRAVCKSV